MKRRVALIFGGEGCEKSISELSAENLYRLIEGDAYEILPIGISEEGNWYIYGGSADKIGSGEWERDSRFLKKTHPIKSGFMTDGGIIRVHSAILCLHGDFGEDGTVAGALTVAHIPYVGQDVYASAVTQDKAYTKCIAEHLGIRTAKWMLSCGEESDEARRRAEEKIGYPMFLKPPRLGSSYGAHPVYKSSEFRAAFEDARSYDTRVLIESLVDFEYEAECALFADGRERLYAVGKIDSGGTFYDFSAKYENKNSPRVTSGGIDDDVCRRIKEMTAEISRYIGLRHLSRIDFFVTKNKEIYFNEINTFPGMTGTSLYPALTESMGLRRGEFILRLIEAVSEDDGHL